MQRSAFRSGGARAVVGGMEREGGVGVVFVFLLTTADLVDASDVVVELLR